MPPSDLSQYTEAERWFIEQLGLSEEELERIAIEANARGITAAELLALRLYQDLISWTNQAEARGDDLLALKAALKTRLAKAYGPSGYRHSATWITTVQKAYNRGRWNQLRHSVLLRERPYWMYDAILDSKTTVTCRERDGITRPTEDAFWGTNWPPLHVRCRSGIRSLREAQGKRRLTSDEQLAALGSDPQEGLGKAPSLSTDYQPDPERYDAELWDIYQRRVA